MKTLRKRQKDSDQVQFNLDDAQWQLFCDVLDKPATSIDSIRKLLNEPSLLDEPLSAKS